MGQSVRRIAVGAVGLAAAAGAVTAGAFFASLTSQDQPPRTAAAPSASASGSAAPTADTAATPEFSGGPTPSPSTPSPSVASLGPAPAAPAQPSGPTPAAPPSGAPGSSPAPPAAQAGPAPDTATVSRVRAACVRQLQQDEAASGNSAAGKYTVDSVEFEGPVTRASGAAAYDAVVTVGTTLADGSPATTRRTCRVHDLPGGVQWMPAG